MKFRIHSETVAPTMTRWVVDHPNGREFDFCASFSEAVMRFQHLACLKTQHFLPCAMISVEGTAGRPEAKRDEHCGKPAVIIAVLAEKEFTAKLAPLCDPCAVWLCHHMLPGQYKFKAIPK